MHWIILGAFPFPCCYWWTCCSSACYRPWKWDQSPSQMCCCTLFFKKTRAQWVCEAERSWLWHRHQNNIPCYQVTQKILSLIHEIVTGGEKKYCHHHVFPLEDTSQMLPFHVGLHLCAAWWPILRFSISSQNHVRRKTYKINKKGSDGIDAPLPKGLSPLSSSPGGPRPTCGVGFSAWFLNPRWGFCYAISWWRLVFTVWRCCLENISSGILCLDCTFWCVW